MFPARTWPLQVAPPPHPTPPPHLHLRALEPARRNDVHTSNIYLFCRIEPQHMAPSGRQGWWCSTISVAHLPCYGSSSLPESDPVLENRYLCVSEYAGPAGPISDRAPRIRWCWCVPCSQFHHPAKNSLEKRELLVLMYASYIHTDDWMVVTTHGECLTIYLFSPFVQTCGVKESRTRYLSTVVTVVVLVNRPFSLYYLCKYTSYVTLNVLNKPNKSKSWPPTSTTSALLRTGAVLPLHIWISGVTPESCPILSWTLLGIPAVVLLQGFVGVAMRMGVPPLASKATLCGVHGAAVITTVWIPYAVWINGKTTCRILLKIRKYSLCTALTMITSRVTRLFMAWWYTGSLDLLSHTCYVR